MRDFVDLAVWVSRDRSAGVALGQLFEERMNDSQVKAALATLGGLALAAPQAAVAVGAVAAVATIVRVGGELVRAATGAHIGLHRRSFLGFERFGVGRTPPHGLRQAQDIEFAYEIVEV